MATVLLAEDNPDTVDFLSRRLREAGFEVCVARNGFDALAVAARELPDAIVIDVNLPRISGDEVVRRLRGAKETCAIPVIFVTAESASRVSEFLVPGQVLCMEKAIRSHALLANLNRLLAGGDSDVASPG